MYKSVEINARYEWEIKVNESILNRIGSIYITVFSVFLGLSP